MDLQVGDLAPNFYLPSVQGDNFLFENQLEKYKGSWHLIVFFRGSWSASCIEQLTAYEQVKEQWAKENLRIIAISSDNLDDLKRMAHEEPFTFPILSDEFFSVIDAFGVYKQTRTVKEELSVPHNEPAHYLINEEGKIVYIQKQSAPFGRPLPRDLRRTVGYLKKAKTNSTSQN
ncbi:peroxiredoxin family protein [Halobacillus trueperi]|uniref:Peroxiredoxin n=1 Tax=Halobacillus trueperi TaxID=156205 RepID=A0A3E0J2L8_9BACI|nr:peroxiredoxin family protein [Halobacillus trueperi]REJ07152.1 peroxiredoxin [Halobacillus trueperi]